MNVGIIGGGVGGLAAAIRLSSAGYKVTLFEQNDSVGGKLAGRTIGDEQSYVDLGPTVLTMPFVFDELFAAAGADLRQRVPLRRVDPTCRYRWSDGTTFDAHAGRDLLLDEVGRVFPADSDAFATFLDDTARLYDATKEIFLFRPFRGLRELTSLRNISLAPMLGRLGFTSTMISSLRKRFRSKKLIEMLARFATYNGSSPYKAPATLNVIAHVELSLGTWYPIGGMARFAEELGRLATESGVDVRTGSTVTGLTLGRSGRSIDRVITDTAEHTFDLVISNLDVSATWRRLLEPAGLPIPRSVGRSDPSCSGYLLALSVEGTSDGPQHEIYFSDRYEREFDQIFEQRQYPDEPTIYRSIASRTDRGDRTDGIESWYVLVNTPADAGRNLPNGYDALILDRLSRFGLEPRIRSRSSFDPGSIESRTGSPGGAIYGSSSNSILSAFLRPRNRSSRVENLYFVGGSAHPGGGLPLVALSGRHVAELITARYGRSA